MRRELHPLYDRRLREFLPRLKRDILADAVPVAGEVMVTDEPVAFAERLASRYAYRPIGVGDAWGCEWQSAWFHLAGQVPASWAGRDVGLLLNVNGEACVFDAQGCPAHGLTNQSVFDAEYGKDLYRLWEPCTGGETLDLWIEAAANTLFGVNRRPGADRSDPARHGTHTGIVQAMALRVINTPVWRLWLDADVLAGLYHSLDPESPRAAAILASLARAMDAYGDDPSRADAARAILAETMAVPPNPADLGVTAVGHAHIDTGWLWPVRESVRKCARTFASQIALLERYPDYVFGASQPQHYQFMKDHYPALYEKIRRYIRENRWECQGGMWVEADCNLPNGESLVRQFLHGKNFFREEFGVDVRNLWLPDVFGYSAALPQIIRKAGCDAFLTQKMSWSQLNRFPHHTFRWRGIDGTEVLTHFPPEDNYNSPLEPGLLRTAQNRFRENGRIPAFLSLFGIGNGGGGPKEEHVERGLRMHALNGCPRVRFGAAQPFFDQLQAHGNELESWSGELYLELHRGTLTTQAAVKKGNRSLEHKLRETEFLCALLPLAAYPADTLDRAWKLLLLNQFHDILPGSSIHQVYETTHREHAEAAALCRRAIRAAAARLFEPDDEALVLFNSLDHAYTEPFRLPADWADTTVTDGSHQPVTTQPDPGGCLVSIPLPPLSFTTLHKGSATARSKPATASGPPWILENAAVRYAFAGDGTIIRLTDKATGFEWIRDGEPANRLSLYVDRPHAWDAWDVDPWYKDQLLEHAHPTAEPACLSGPVQTRLRFELAIGKSRIIQTAALSPSSARLDLETWIDWQESHRMLRVAFPTTLHADEASFEIQYGWIRRPTHQNTSWDLARFEVAAQRYAVLSDGAHGLALLNNGKYGHHANETTLDLNLLRSPSEPDPDADVGEHTFTYSLFPHRDTFPNPDVRHQAAMLNQPPLAIPGFATHHPPPMPCRLDADGIAWEVLKKAEREDCLILRFVETMGRLSHGTLTLHPPYTHLTETNLLEWTDGPSLPGPNIPLSLHPFEIRSYKLHAP
jgi:alpha-mannosidase